MTAVPMMWNLPELFAWLGLAVFFTALRASDWKSGTVCGLVFGLAYFMPILYWLLIFGALPWVIVSLYQAAIIAAFSLVASFVLPERRTWLGFIGVPALWAVVQFLRAQGTYAFTWASFAHLAADDPYIIQLGSITGPLGIDFLMCMLGFTLSYAVLPIASRKLRFMPFIAAAAVWTVIFLWGMSMGVQFKPDEKRLDFVQVAVAQASLKHGVVPRQGYNDDAFADYQMLTLNGVQAGADLVVWPETSIVSNVTGSQWERGAEVLADLSEITLIVGGYDGDGPDDTSLYNSAHVYGPDGEKTGIYRKVRLVPFGEFVPLRDKLPFLANYRVRAHDVVPGDSFNVIDTVHGRIGIGICFESLFSDVFARLARDGAEYFVVMTNDSWFERTTAARQHLQMSQLRAAENRKYVIRAALTGVSAVIDPYGRVAGEIGLFDVGTLNGKVVPNATPTFFARYSDYVVYPFAIVALLALVLPERRREE